MSLKRESVLDLVSSFKLDIEANDKQLDEISNEIETLTMQLKLAIKRKEGVERRRREAIQQLKHVRNMLYQIDDAATAMEREREENEYDF